MHACIINILWLILVNFEILQSDTEKLFQLWDGIHKKINQFGQNHLSVTIEKVKEENISSLGTKIGLMARNKPKMGILLLGKNSETCVQTSLHNYIQYSGITSCSD